MIEKKFKDLEIGDLFYTIDECNPYYFCYKAWKDGFIWINNYYCYHIENLDELVYVPDETNMNKYEFKDIEAGSLFFLLDDEISKDNLCIKIDCASFQKKYSQSETTIPIHSECLVKVPTLTEYMKVVDPPTFNPSIYYNPHSESFECWLENCMSYSID